MCLICALVQGMKWISLVHLWPAVMQPSPIFMYWSLILLLPPAALMSVSSNINNMSVESIMWNSFRNTDLGSCKRWEKVYGTQWKKNAQFKKSKHSTSDLEKYSLNMFSRGITFWLNSCKKTWTVGKGAAGRQETCFHRRIENVGCRIWGNFLINWKTQSRLQSFLIPRYIIKEWLNMLLSKQSHCKRDFANRLDCLVINVLFL